MPKKANAQILRCAQNDSRSTARGGYTGDRIAVRHPIFAEAGCQHHHVKMGKAHGLQRPKRGPDIGTFLDGAAAAVNVYVRVAGEFAGNVFQRLPTLRGGGGTGIDGAGDVLTFVENLKANLQDDRFCAGRVREQRRQLAGLGDLRRRPGIGSGILCMGRHRQNARYSQDRDRRVPQGCASGKNSHGASVRLQAETSIIRRLA